MLFAPIIQAQWTGIRHGRRLNDDDGYGNHDYNQDVNSNNPDMGFVAAFVLVMFSLSFMQLCCDHYHTREKSHDGNTVCSSEENAGSEPNNDNNKDDPNCVIPAVVVVVDVAASTEPDDDNDDDVVKRTTHEGSMIVQVSKDGEPSW